MLWDTMKIHRIKQKSSGIGVNAHNHGHIFPDPLLNLFLKFYWKEIFFLNSYTLIRVSLPSSQFLPTSPSIEIYLVLPKVLGLSNFTVTQIVRYGICLVEWALCQSRYWFVIHSNLWHQCTSICCRQDSIIDNSICVWLNV